MLLVVGAILAGSIIVALGAARVGVPSLVAFLALGMLLGSDGPGGIEFDDAELARTVGVAGLAAILFEGGLSTSWRRLRRVAVPATLLATVGVVASTVLTGVAAYYPSTCHGSSRCCWAPSWPRRTRQRFSQRSGSPISGDGWRERSRAETGLNDPVAIALTIGLIAWIEEPELEFPTSSYPSSSNSGSAS